MTTNLKPYPVMKESGIEWLGKVPEHWEVLPGRACLQEKKEPNTGMKEETVLSLSYGKIIVKPKDSLHGLVPESFETYQVIHPGDIVCRPTDLQNDQKSYRFGISESQGIITSAYICLRINAKLNNRFVHLTLHSYDLIKIIYSLGSGLRQNLRWEDFKYLPICIPPLKEQDAIVRYLNHIDKRLRRLMQAKQNLIALLNEQKQAIIHRAVTQGLDPDVPLKDSGVEWLGQIPQHWEVMRTKYIFKEVDKRSATGSETHLSMSQKLGLVPSHMVTSSLISETYIGGKLCEKEDLVLNRLKAHLGVFAIAKQAGVISPDYSVFRNIRKINATYFKQLLRSPACRRELRMRAKGIVEGFWRLYTDDFYDIRVPVPEASEQDAIVDHLGKATADINATINRAEREIELLSEYRTRLIAEVVIGKLDVRDAAAVLPKGDLLSEAVVSDDGTFDLEADSDEFKEDLQEMEK